MGKTTADLGGRYTTEYNRSCVDVALDVEYGTDTDTLGGVNSTNYLLKMVDIALERNYNNSLAAVGGRYSDDYNKTMVDIGLNVTKNTNMELLEGRYSAEYNNTMGVLYTESTTCSEDLSCPSDYFTNPRSFLKQFTGTGCPDPSDSSVLLCEQYVLYVYVGARLCWISLSLSLSLSLSRCN